MDRRHQTRRQAVCGVGARGARRAQAPAAGPARRGPRGAQLTHAFSSDNQRGPHGEGGSGPGLGLDPDVPRQDGFGEQPAHFGPSVDVAAEVVVELRPAHGVGTMAHLVARHVRAVVRRRLLVIKSLRDDAPDRLQAAAIDGDPLVRVSDGRYPRARAVQRGLPKVDWSRLMNGGVRPGQLARVVYRVSTTRRICFQCARPREIMRVTVVRLWWVWVSK